MSGHGRQPGEFSFEEMMAGAASQHQHLRVAYEELLLENSVLQARLKDSGQDPQLSTSLSSQAIRDACKLKGNWDRFKKPDVILTEGLGPTVHWDSRGDECSCGSPCLSSPRDIQKVEVALETETSAGLVAGQKEDLEDRPLQRRSGRTSTADSLRSREAFAAKLDDLAMDTSARLKSPDTSVSVNMATPQGMSANSRFGRGYSTISAVSGAASSSASGRHFNPLSPDAEVPAVWTQWTFDETVDLSASPPPSAQMGRYRNKSRPNISLTHFMSTLADQSIETVRVKAGDAVKDDASRLQRFIMRPHSFRRMAWDAMSILILGYDIINIPLEVFNYERTGFYSMMDWVTTLFWTFDILMSFLTGFHHEGVVEMRPKVIASRYMKTWFAMDMSIVLMDWGLQMIQFSFDAIARLGKANRGVRVLRIVRTVRLIRAAKLSQVFTEMFRNIKSDLFRTVLSISCMLMALLVLNHYLACGWYSIGKVNEQRGPDGSWIVFHRLATSDHLYQYFASLHWCLTQFTPAQSEIYPHGLAERIYAVFVVVIAMVTFSSFLSSITNTMMQFKKLRSDKERQEAVLRQYFTENRLSAELGQQIWNFLKVNHFDHRKVVHKRDIDCLRLLPESIRSRMNEELYLPVILENPFFATFAQMDTAPLCEVVYRAMEEVTLNSGERCFAEGEPAQKMYFLTSGLMDYRHRDRVLSMQIKSGTWACEHTLWLDWTHCGLLIAHSSCELLEVNGRVFRQILAPRLQPVDRAFIAYYANEFRSFVQDEHLWYTDMPPPRVVMEEWVQKLKQDFDERMVDKNALDNDSGEGSKLSSVDSGTRGEIPAGNNAQPLSSLSRITALWPFNRHPASDGGEMA